MISFNKLRKCTTGLTSKIDLFIKDGIFIEIHNLIENEFYENMIKAQKINFYTFQLTSRLICL